MKKGTLDDGEEIVVTKNRDVSDILKLNPGLTKILCMHHTYGKMDGKYNTIQEQRITKIVRKDNKG